MPTQTHMVSGDSLKAGCTLPTFTLVDELGKIISSRALFAKGPLVICFYPRASSTNCVSGLTDIASSYRSIRERGASFVAIVAEGELNDVHGLPFPFVHDIGARIAQKFGIAITSKMLFEGISVGMRKDCSPISDEELVSLPATFIADSKGRIVFSFITESTSSRMQVSDVLEVLEHLKRREQSLLFAQSQPNLTDTLEN